MDARPVLLVVARLQASLRDPLRVEGTRRERIEKRRYDSMPTLFRQELLMTVTSERQHRTDLASVPKIS